MKNRIIKVSMTLLVILIIGIIYALIVNKLGKGIPCIVKSITGLNCPTCGITRQIICILNFDFKNAREYNYVLFYMYPFIIIFIVYLLYRYIRYSKLKFNLFEIIYIIVMCFILLIWFINRNIYMI